MKFSYQKLSNYDGLQIEGPLLIKPNVFEDKRGFFMESWNKKDWDNLMQENNQSKNNFVQDNHSKSSTGVLRGLHYQKNPNAQGKLVRCIYGEIYDVAVDIRKKSSTFGHYVGVLLSSVNHYQLWVPIGFAHGFLTISQFAEVAYKATNFWDKDSERSILWNDPSINIKWPKELLKNNGIIVSEKDSQASLIKEMNSEDLFL